jgi:putative glutathione S-transferase
MSFRWNTLTDIILILHFVELGALFPPEHGRYHLFASYACPGSHRALVMRALKGLEDVVSVTIVHPIWRLTKEGTKEEQRGWVFGDPNGRTFVNTAGRGGPFEADFPGTDMEPFYNSFSIRDIYDRAGGNAGKYTVPLLWDKKEETIVNNESSDIAYMLNSSFNEFAKNPGLDLYTEEDCDKLNDVIDWLSPLMIHGVYRCGFAKKQEAYDKAVTELTDAFDQADLVLSKQRYLTGDTLTDADIRLFVTLFRFDEIYAVYFRANTRLVTLTPSLLNYCRDIYQLPGVAQTCSMDHCKAHFFCSHAEWNKFSIVPKGLGFLKLLNQPHDRNGMLMISPSQEEI